MEIGIALAISVVIIIVGFALHRFTETNNTKTKEEVEENEWKYDEIDYALKVINNSYTQDTEWFKNNCPWTWAYKGELVLHYGKVGLIKWALLETLSPDMNGLGALYETFIKCHEVAFGDSKIRKDIESFIEKYIDPVLLTYADTLKNIRESSKKKL